MREPSSPVSLPDSSSRTMSLRAVILLRGINVGGRHPVPMAALRRLAEEQGCHDVVSYIQSGNLVVTVSAAFSSSMLAAAIERLFGFAVPITMRTLPEITTLVETNPFVPAGRALETLHCVFLRDPLASAQREKLNALCVGGEAIAASARELLLYLPNGAGRSKLATACTAGSMPGSPTIRNWKTVLALAAMLRQ
ncbi:DUF1697 domain-containing protein [Acidipila sp. EB88]|uniref:DUF1697 domain-containing protein n=1 Tax=Acidipila sp. EB88 TaxID=2305226 RepID=UPI000F5E7C84|nr:DUF1697 domain-containing protein [Acidipila sp. EB88]RRA48418.1 DUF1697 domain-containing protein [Acidipila sp. EB88]